MPEQNSLKHPPGFRPRLPRKPKQPSAGQFKKARKKLGWSRAIVEKASVDLGLPVSESAIGQIEKGETVARPTKSEPRIDFCSKDGVGCNMSYEQRLHLVYLMLGCVFLPGDDVAKADPFDLWGAFDVPEKNGKRTIEGVGIAEDAARVLISRAFKRASRK